VTKATISEGYINSLKVQHSGKRAPDNRFIALTGAGREGSIGEAIKEKFTVVNSDIVPVNVTAGIRSFDVEDVIDDHFDFTGFTDLIMCHGYTYMDWLEEVPDEEVEKIINTNLYGSIRVIKQFVEQTIDEPFRKKIISIGSMAYKAVLNGSAAYCASKAGLNHYIRCAAWELAPKAYDVYCINPSNVLDAPMTKDTINHLMNYRQLTLEQAIDYWGANNPREVFLTKAEITDLVLHLLFTDKGYMSGAPIDLGGGQR
jgi:NAD(P)-dependent dehydrogenase (short-subunit alcohol dehydrogenase family)